MHAFFSCLHCHRIDPICVTYEQKFGIGSHLTDSVNGAYDAAVLSMAPIKFTIFVPCHFALFDV